MFTAKLYLRYGCFVARRVIVPHTGEMPTIDTIAACYSQMPCIMSASLRSRSIQSKL